MDFLVEIFHKKRNGHYCYMMHGCHTELLMNIADEDIDTLSDMYKVRGGIPYASGALAISKRVRKRRPYYLRFLSAGNCWKEDGTYFAVMEMPHVYHLAIFTLDKTCKTVYEGLMNTGRLHFGRPLGLFAIHDIVYPTVLQVIREKRLLVKSDVPHQIFSLSRDKALQYIIEYPEDVLLKRLNPLHSKTIESHWTDRFPHSQEYLACLIQLVGGWGIFLKTTNELVSWALLTAMGQIGMIQTLEGYQKKGYGSIVTKAAARRMGEWGVHPTATVALDDVASHNMFKKLGFEKKGTCNYITLERSL